MFHIAPRYHQVSTSNNFLCLTSRSTDPSHTRIASSSSTNSSKERSFIDSFGDKGAKSGGRQRCNRFCDGCARGGVVDDKMTGTAKAVTATP